MTTEQAETKDTCKCTAASQDSATGPGCGVGDCHCPSDCADCKPGTDGKTETKAGGCPFLRAHPNWRSCPFLKGMFGFKSGDESAAKPEEPSVPVAQEAGASHQTCTESKCTKTPGAECPMKCHESSGFTHPLKMSLDAEVVEEKTEDFAL